MNPIRLLSAFNPGNLDQATLKTNFVARDELLSELLEAIEQENSTSVAHHLLLLGQRGMGKTTLLRRLAYAVVEAPKLERIWLPLIFPEEQYNIVTLADFWRNCIDALIDTMEARGLGTHEDLEQAQRALEGKSSHEALAILLSAADRLNRRLLLLVDNLDLVFERLSEPEAWELRATLQKPGGPMVIASAIQALEASFSYEQAFYDFLRHRYVDSLTLKESLHLLTVLAERNGRADIANEIRLRPERISAIQLFSGGNIRTLILLFRVLAQGLDANVERDLEDLLDLCTPLYKARIEAMPAQQQRAFICLALAYDPKTAADVEEQIKLGINQTSAVLNKMVRTGLLRRGPMLEKKLSFEVAERFFNIWYLMRAARRERQKLLWLARFIHDFYANDHTEMTSAISRQLQAGHGDELAFAFMELSTYAKLPRSAVSLIEGRVATVSKKPQGAKVRPRAQVERDFNTRFFRHYDWLLPVLQALSIDLDELQSFRHVEGVLDAVTRGEDSHREKLETLLASEAKQMQFRARTRKSGGIEEKIRLLQDAVALDAHDPHLWINLGLCLAESSDFFRAEHALTQATVLTPDLPIAWAELGFFQLDGYALDEAKKSLETALRAAPNYIEAIHALGWVYFRQGDFVRAENQARMAIKLNRSYVQAWDLLGRALSLPLRQPDGLAEAQHAIEKSLELDPSNQGNHLWFARFLEVFKKDVTAAQVQYQKTVELFPLFHKAKLSHARLFARMGNLKHAKKIITETIKSAPKNAQAWFYLACNSVAEGNLLGATDFFSKALEPQEAGFDTSDVLTWPDSETLRAYQIRLHCLLLACVKKNQLHWKVKIWLKTSLTIELGKTWAAIQSSGIESLLMQSQRPLFEAFKICGTEQPHHIATLATEVREATYLVLMRHAPLMAKRIRLELPALVAGFSEADSIEGRV
jgi:Tfp pilus assembly protein PilF